MTVLLVMTTQLVDRDYPVETRRAGLVRFHSRPERERQRLLAEAFERAAPFEHRAHFR